MQWRSLVLKIRTTVQFDLQRFSVLGRVRRVAMPEAECVNLLCRCVRCVTALEAPQYCSQHKKHHQPVAV